jgi:osmoprotectant transport system permease protein
VTGDVLDWLLDGTHWQGGEGIPLRVWQHVAYSLIAVGIATVLAVPVGLWVGHTGRGRFVAVNLVGILRAVPSLGLLFASLMLLGPKIPGELGVHVPVQVVLVVLAMPPILAGAYAGVEAVDPAARDAARGMGMQGRDVLRRVELPCALPLIFSGIRSAVLQVVATATLAATVGLGGLGHYLIDGLATRDYAQMAGGALLVAALALLLDLVAATLQRLVVSPGLTGKTGRRTAEGLDRTASTDPRDVGVLTEGTTR